MVIETITIKIRRFPKSLIRAIGKGRDKIYKFNFKKSEVYLTHGLTVERRRNIFS